MLIVQVRVCGTAEGSLWRHLHEGGYNSRIGPPSENAQHQPGLYIEAEDR